MDKACCNGNVHCVTLAVACCLAEEERRMAQADRCTGFVGGLAVLLGCDGQYVYGDAMNEAILHVSNVYMAALNL